MKKSRSKAFGREGFYALGMCRWKCPLDLKQVVDIVYFMSLTPYCQTHLTDFILYHYI